MAVADSSLPKSAPLLSMADVCERLKMNRQTIRRLMRTQGLRYVRLGQKLRFRPEWVEEFIDRDAGTPPPRRERPKAKTFRRKSS